ncbi:phosphonopyruvate decarboxylase [Clostridium collagenovorans DSM 3089]|uniref:Phosphonopyruvate decarboxylase n=1 Tax=Clostridium collagenovorans DSM 3089 TaxID=1121306 RepID=A0A1M5WTL7_9CLOT|nr:phosphonopyruvate decarboxylase [Clostridium collagenovorans]SHH90899.1 phosphonopyruvate decarboxylase [Clostridium collagenovorans DSM 3089]
MVTTELFYNYLKEKGVTFFAGVPDSLLKNFCAYLTDNEESDKNIIAANEGNALGMAAGHYLATGSIPLVYMQNSGLGNIVNPLTSLTDPLVYSIPTLLVIGWRGEPNKKDEPQHKKQGLITLELLDALGIKYSVLGEENSDDEAKIEIDKAITYMKENKEPYAIVIRKNTFSEYKLKNKIATNFDMKREEAIEVLLDYLNEKDTIVSTTGKTSRELFELREKRNEGHEKDFLTVGSMGHASQIALGIALNKKDRNVYCLDGDGAALMHLGGLAIIASQEVKNFKHIVINNGAHESVGGQPTVGFEIDILGIAKGCGYKEVFTASTKAELQENMKKLAKCEGPGLLEIRVNKGSRDDLGRPTTTTIENKEALMAFLDK